MSKVLEKRLSDFPLRKMDLTTYPVLLTEGTLAAAGHFAPYKKGGYSLQPQPSAFYTPPAGEVIIGASDVGLIYTSTPQLTIATRKAASNALYQRRVLADGTGDYWGMLFGSSQDFDRTRIVYYRMNAKEYTLGWDPDAYGYHCHLFESVYVPVGVEPMLHTGITAVEASGGDINEGYVRIYLANKAAFSGTARYGASDLTNHIDVHLTGDSKKIDIASIPVGVWPSTEHVYIYRTRVVASSAQLDLEKAYLETAITTGTTTATLSMSDDRIREIDNQLQSGKYDFPTVGKTGKFQDNLKLGEHNGHLLVSGVEKAYRIIISGYIDNDLAVHNDADWWGFFIDVPKGETIYDFHSINGKLTILTDRALYVVSDESSNPNSWTLSQVAQIGGSRVDCMEFVQKDLFFVGKDSRDVYSVFRFDGFRLESVGDPIGDKLDSDSLLVDINLYPTIAGDEDSAGYVYGIGQAWGHIKLDDSASPSIKTLRGVGSYSTFQSGLDLFVDSAAVKYYGTSYASSSSEVQLTSRSFFTMPEERTEWIKLFVHAARLSGVADVTVNVSFIIDGVTHSDLLTITVDKDTIFSFELGIPEAVRQAKTLQVVLGFPDGIPIVVAGITVQARTVISK